MSSDLSENRLSSLSGFNWISMQQLSTLLAHSLATLACRSLRNLTANHALTDLSPLRNCSRLQFLSVSLACVCKHVRSGMLPGINCGFFGCRQFVSRLPLLSCEIRTDSFTIVLVRDISSNQMFSDSNRPFIFDALPFLQSMFVTVCIVHSDRCSNLRNNQISTLAVPQVFLQLQIVYCTC